jgi:hypothetical protein
MMVGFNIYYQRSDTNHSEAKAGHLYFRCVISRNWYSYLEQMMGLLFMVKVFMLIMSTCDINFDSSSPLKWFIFVALKGGPFYGQMMCCKSMCDDVGSARRDNVWDNSLVTHLQ